MDISEAVVLEVWEMFSEHLPLSKRNDMAVRYLKILVDHEVEPSELEELRGEDEHIDYALDQLDSDDDDDIYPSDEEYDE